MKNRNLTHTLRISYTILLLITLIPSVYSIIVSQIHSFRYTQIIQNVSYANRINNIAKNEIPNELWEIICGKKDFNSGLQYQMMEEISTGLYTMLQSTRSTESRIKLEVANRAGITLLRNINNETDWSIGPNTIKYTSKEYEQNGNDSGWAAAYWEFDRLSDYNKAVITVKGLNPNSYGMKFTIGGETSWYKRIELDEDEYDLHSRAGIFAELEKAPLGILKILHML